jgi:hypothetical protein
MWFCRFQTLLETNIQQVLLVVNGLNKNGYQKLDYNEPADVIVPDGSPALSSPKNAVRFGVSIEVNISCGPAFRVNLVTCRWCIPFDCRWVFWAWNLSPGLDTRIVSHTKVNVYRVINDQIHEWPYNQENRTYSIQSIGFQETGGRRNKGRSIGRCRNHQCKQIFRGIRLTVNWKLADWVNPINLSPRRTKKPSLQQQWWLWGPICRSYGWPNRGVGHHHRSRSLTRCQDQH